MERVWSNRPIFVSKIYPIRWIDPIPVIQRKRSKNSQSMEREREKKNAGIVKKRRSTRNRKQSFPSRYRKPIIRAGASALIPLMGRQPLSLPLPLSKLSSRDVGRRLNDVQLPSRLITFARSRLSNTRWMARGIVSREYYSSSTITKIRGEADNIDEAKIMGEDGLPTLFLNARPDFNSSPLITSFEKK